MLTFNKITRLFLVVSVVILLCAIFHSISFAADIPPRAKQYLPQVKEAIRISEFPKQYPAFIPAQIEQETCITPTHSKCWNPRAELKTSREYGFGLGQITIAYNSDGTERFNVFKELTANKKFANWSWENRYDPTFQIRAIIFKDQLSCNKMQFTIQNEFEKLAFCAAGYNGGYSGVLKDRLLCVNKEGCDPSRWFGGVELYSTKSKTPMKEYGNKSVFQINREYPYNILKVRMPKYEPYFRTGQ